MKARRIVAERTLQPTKPYRTGLTHRLLLRLEPERAHGLAMTALRAVSSLGPGRGLLRAAYRTPEGARLEQRLFGRTFPNPVGLAAGFDKNARAIHGFEGLGFGFVEVGTVTPLAQPGNPKPRIFRHPEKESLQNALGFNNDGMGSIHRRVVAGRPYRVPLGVNVGKNAITKLENAESDYEQLFRRFQGSADYFVINISSPNTPGLRDLQTPERIAGLVRLGLDLGAEPVLVKLSPDLEVAEALALVQGAIEAGAAGVIVTNTTTDYDLLPGAARKGGLSGAVLRARSYKMLQALASEFFGHTTLISVGGVDSGDEVYRRVRAGASLVQIYTAMIYRGPRLVCSCLRRLVQRLDADGFETLEEAVGADMARKQQ